MSQKQPRAFISYSHADKAYVSTLVDELKRLGVGVWIDEVEIVIGDSLIERLGGAISESDFLVAIISPHSVDSPWCQKELALAATQGIGQRRVKVLPVRLGGVDMPSFLQDAVWGDAALHTPEGLAAELAVAMEHHLDLRGSQPVSAGPPDASSLAGRAQASPTTATPRMAQPATQPVGVQPWVTEGQATAIPSSGRDADGFSWGLRRGDETHRIVVWISRDAVASRDSGLPREVVQAKQTKGRSVLGPLVSQDSPPVEVLVSTYGVRWERVEASGGEEGASPQGSEPPEPREPEVEYRSNSGMPGAFRLSLLKELRDLILDAKDAAREALDNGDEVTPRLINVERRIKTTIKQLGDVQLPDQLANFVNQAQNARSTMSRWQAADAVVEQMIIDATEALRQP